MKPTLLIQERFDKWMYFKRSSEPYFALFLCMYLASYTVYYPDQQMHNTYALTIYRKYPYMFRCTHIMLREFYPSVLLKLQKSSIRCGCIETCRSTYDI